MKTLDGVLTKVNAEGEKTSITSRCADLNREVSSISCSHFIFHFQDRHDWVNSKPSVTRTDRVLENRPVQKSLEAKEMWFLRQLRWQVRIVWQNPVGKKKNLLRTLRRRNSVFIAHKWELDMGNILTAGDINRKKGRGMLRDKIINSPAWR